MKPYCLLITALAMTGSAGALLGKVAATPLPRVILAIYDSRYQKDVRDTRIHRLLEMPLNHLGLVVHYQDRNAGLPPPESMRDVRGIITWFQSDSMQNPEEFLAWAETAIDAGKRFVVLGDLSVNRNLRGQTTRTALVNRFLAKVGLRADNWVPVTYNYRIVYKDPLMMDFERPLPAVLPPFDSVKVTDRSVRVHLLARKADDSRSESALVVTGPHGAYAATGYTHFSTYAADANSQTGEAHMQWYLNPFEFFRLAFATDELPKPDTTTVVGRRIYYSHIDGDGWRNQTEVARYRAQRLSSAEVILREIIRPFPDLPVTVGPIAGDLDPHWFGNEESLRVARQILAIPWVEAGSHTYSHPLDWETLSLEAKEDATAARGGFWAWWRRTPWPLWERLAEQWSDKYTGEDNSSDQKPKFHRGQSRLRSYDLYPFDMNQEIAGSIDFINRLLPAGKRVQLLQWSGTTLESESVMEATRRAGVRNINGGDTRFDPEFDSYAWVSPLGRQVGRYEQVYSSESNENTYTNLWNARYFGFRYLVQTLRNTESPIRVKPFNLYYHMFSGEKEPGLEAVLGNLAYARSQQLAPLTASRYASIVDGFFSVAFTEMGNRRWRVEHRDGLNTIRFDRAETQGVDWGNSRGVIGQRHYQGSLYVALDPADESPIVALAETSARSQGPLPDGRGSASASRFCSDLQSRDRQGAVCTPQSRVRPYLIQSRWLVSHLQISSGGFSFSAYGFGPGEMEWQARPAARFTIRVSCHDCPTREIETAAGRDGVLRFSLTDKQPAGDSSPVDVTVKEAGTNL